MSEATVAEAKPRSSGYEVAIYLKDGKAFGRTYISMEMGPTAVLLSESESVYTLIPLASINYMDVTEIP